MYMVKPRCLKVSQPVDSGTYVDPINIIGVFDNSVVYIEAQHGFKVGRAFRDNRQEIYKPKILYIYIFHHCLIHYTPIVHLAGTLWLGRPAQFHQSYTFDEKIRWNGDDKKLVMD